MSEIINESMKTLRQALMHADDEETEFLIKIFKKCILSADLSSVATFKVSMEVEKLKKLISPKKVLEVEDVYWMLTSFNIVDDFPEFNSLREKTDKFGLRLDVSTKSLDNFNTHYDKLVGRYDIVMEVGL